MHRFFLAQVLGVVAAASFVRILGTSALSLFDGALLQGFLASFFSIILRGPRWWLPLHLTFFPAIVLVERFHIDPAWFLAGFVLLMLVYWSSFKSRVPLYLTNAQSTDALLSLLRDMPVGRFIDAGCGTGSLLQSLARARPESLFEGWEVAPLPWLIARIRTRNLKNCLVHRRSFWRDSWGNADLLYVFLSPVPMARVWSKAVAEMSPGTLLISNSFNIPYVHPEQVIEVPDSRRTCFYLYRIPVKASPVIGVACPEK